MSPAEIIFEVVEDAECGYRARGLGHDIFTFGATEQELRANVHEAVMCHFDDGERPGIVRLHFIRDEVFTV